MTSIDVCEYGAQLTLYTSYIKRTICWRPLSLILSTIRQIVAICCLTALIGYCIKTETWGTLSASIECATRTSISKCTVTIRARLIFNANTSRITQVISNTTYLTTWTITLITVSNITSVNTSSILKSISSQTQSTCIISYAEVTAWYITGQ